MLKFLKYITFFSLSLTALFLTAYTALFFHVKNQTKCNKTAGTENVMIFATHPDDGVITAGGYAVQTMKNGGSVKVVYMTGSEPRLKEAYNAWSIIGLSRDDLIHLGFDDNADLTLNNTSEKLRVISNVISDYKPDTVFIPLYEGGHISHDITNYLVSTSVKFHSRDIKLYECPEYNYYFSVKNTPEKYLDIFSKWIPFFEYHAPPEFIDRSGALYLCMEKKDLETKKKMLSQFVSQRPDILLMHFGFPDRFKEYTDHEYILPPHDHGNLILYAARNYLGDKVRTILSRPYWNLKTIYNDVKKQPLKGLLTTEIGE